MGRLIYDASKSAEHVIVKLKARHLRRKRRVTHFLFTCQVTVAYPLFRV